MERKRHILFGIPAVGDDAAGVAAEVAALERRGWAVTAVRDAATLIAHAASRDHALCLLDARFVAADAQRVVDHVARLPPPRGLLPVVALGPDAPLPDDRTLRAIDAAAPRPQAPPPDVLARLGPMFGDDAVRALVARFRERLGALLDAADPCTIGEGATITDIAHRIAGMAGMLDLTRLAAVWRRVESGDGDAVADAWFETRITHAALTLLLDTPPAAAVDACDGMV